METLFLTDNCLLEYVQYLTIWLTKSFRILSSPAAPSLSSQCCSLHHVRETTSLSFVHIPMEVVGTNSLHIHLNTNLNRSSSDDVLPTLTDPEKMSASSKKMMLMMMQQAKGVKEGGSSEVAPGCYHWRGG